MAPKVIAVCGATGQKGGATLRALQQLQPDAILWALTRNPDSDASRALARRGVEVVQADYEDPPSLRTAFEGCDAVFGVTDFWKACGLDVGREIQQGKNLVDAARAAGVKHFVWSTLEDTRPAMAKLGVHPVSRDCTVPHFDGKTDVEKYLREQMPGAWTALITSIFYENFLPGHGFDLQKQQDGSFSLFLPSGEAKMAWCSTEHIGHVAAAVIAGGPEKFAGRTVPVVGDVLSAREAAEAFTRVFGRKVTASCDLSPADWSEALRGAGVPQAVAEDLANMFRFYRDCGMLGLRPPEGTRAVHPGPQTLEAFLEHHRDSFAEVFASEAAAAEE